MNISSVCIYLLSEYLCVCLGSKYQKVEIIVSYGSSILNNNG